MAIGLRCPLGDVVDLSTTGLRARSHGKPALRATDTVTLALDSESQSIRVAGRAAWVRRTGLRTFEVGIQFIDVRPGIAAALGQLAQYGFIPADCTSAPKSAPTGHTGPQVRAAVMIEDLYAVFGLSREATDDQIRDTYKALARRYHPDVSTDTEAQERFTLVSKAYSVLRDPDRRKRYDQMLDQASDAA